MIGGRVRHSVFVMGTHDHPRMRHYLDLYKIEGKPYYCFHTPYHLCHFEVPKTITRAVLFGDAAIAPGYGWMPLGVIRHTGSVKIIPRATARTCCRWDWRMGAVCAEA